MTMSEESMSQNICSMNHDDCITCSDAGVRLRVLSVEGEDALCEDAAGERARIAVELVSPVRTGEVLLTHGGVAIGKVEAPMQELTAES